MARRYLIWCEWEGGAEEGKKRQGQGKGGRVTRSRGMSEEEVEGRQEGKINMAGAEDVTVSARFA
jgi:hypothetical protein